MVTTEVMGGRRVVGVRFIASGRASGESPAARLKSPKEHRVESAPAARLKARRSTYQALPGLERGERGGWWVREVERRAVRTYDERWKCEAGRTAVRSYKSGGGAQEITTRIVGCESARRGAP